MLKSISLGRGVRELHRHREGRANRQVVPVARSLSRITWAEDCHARQLSEHTL
jgi:hypothetical protein